MTPDSLNIAGLLGAVVTVMKVLEKTFDHFADKWRPNRPVVIQLDPEASRMLVDVHNVVSREDADGGKRIYVPSQTIRQVDEIHQHVLLNGHLKDN